MLQQSRLGSGSSAAVGTSAGLTRQLPCSKYSCHCQATNTSINTNTTTNTIPQRERGRSRTCHAFCQARTTGSEADTQHTTSPPSPKVIPRSHCSGHGFGSVAQSAPLAPKLTGDTSPKPWLANASHPCCPLAKLLCCLPACVLPLLPTCSLSTCCGCCSRCRLTQAAAQLSDKAFHLRSISCCGEPW